MQVTLTIDGQDYTDRLLVEHPAAGVWSLDLNEGAEIDQAVFSLDDPDRDLALTEWKEVIVTQTDVAPNRKIFGGYLLQFQSSESGLGLVWNCGAMDYTILLHRATVDKDYEDEWDDDIIADAFAEAELDGIIDVSTLVQRIKQFDDLRFTGHTLYQLLDLLSEAAGATWHINADKQLVYELVTASEASFSLSDTPNDATAYPYWNLNHQKDGTGVFNHVIVRGGTELSDNQEIILAGDGAETIYVAEDSQDHLISDPPTDADTAFTPQGVARVEVFKNTGTDGSPIWTQQGVGREREDELGTSFGSGKTVDVLWNALTRRLQFDTAPPNLTNSVRVRGRYPIQIEVQRRRNRSVIGFDVTKVIIDEAIKSTDMAVDVASAFLNEHSAAVERIALEFDHDGLDIGERVTVVNSARGINGKYKVQSLSISLLGGTTASYAATLTTGSPPRTLEHILQEIHEAVKKAPPREEARTDVEDVPQELIELVDLSVGARTLGFPYFVTGDDGPVFDLAATLTLADEIPMEHPFHLNNDSAGWPLALFLDPTYSGNRGPATTAYVGFSKVS